MDPEATRVGLVENSRFPVEGVSATSFPNYEAPSRSLPKRMTRSDGPRQGSRAEPVTSCRSRGGDASHEHAIGELELSLTRREGLGGLRRCPPSPVPGVVCRAPARAGTGTLLPLAVSRHSGAARVLSAGQKVAALWLWTLLLLFLLLRSQSHVPESCPEEGMCKGDQGPDPHCASRAGEAR